MISLPAAIKYHNGFFFARIVVLCLTLQGRSHTLCLHRPSLQALCCKRISTSEDRALSELKQEGKGWKSGEPKVYLPGIQSMKHHLLDRVATVCQVSILLSTWHFTLLLPDTFQDKMADPYKAWPKPALTTMNCWCGTKSTLRSSNRTQRVTYQWLFLQRSQYKIHMVMSGL